MSSSATISNPLTSANENRDRHHPSCMTCGVSNHALLSYRPPIRYSHLFYLVQKISLDNVLFSVVFCVLFPPIFSTDTVGSFLELVLDLASRIICTFTAVCRIVRYISRFVFSLLLDLVCKVLHVPPPYPHVTGTCTLLLHVEQRHVWLFLSTPF
jgi:hypothetical protein